MDVLLAAVSPYGSLSLLLWCAVLGAGLGATAATFSRRSQGLFIQALVRASAFTEGDAVPLSALSLKGERQILRQLKEGKPLFRYVRTVEREGEEIRYYLPEDTRYEAEVRYDLRGTDLRGLLLALLLLLLLGIAMQMAVPFLTDILSRTLSSFRA